MGTDTSRKFDWSARLELLEDRYLMAADLLGGSIEHHAIVGEAPPLDHHQESTPDFWIDRTDRELLEEHLQEIEQTLANAHNQTGLTNVRNDYGFTGIGQTVAVIDSGIAYDHFALGGGFGQDYRVVGGWDFTGENDANPYDDGPSGSHGTHVSGIIGAEGGTHTGVAPGVDLVGLRVFDDAGAGYFSWVENALDWIHDNRNSFENPITAVNLSLGVASWNADSIPSWANLEEEFAQLEADGIFISVSAGNSFTSYNESGLSYPAASSYVVPVMSVDDSGNLSYFSQRHERAIAAPGRTIVSTVPDYAGNNNGTDDDYASYSGTSMAAPYVAGASVLIREAMEFVGQTNITQDTIYDHMMATADSIYDAATSQWYSSLNLSAAIDALMPADDYGSTVGTAFDLGTITDTASASGVIGTLDDADFFSFTAGVTGTVTFTASSMTHELQAAWQLSGGTGQASGDNNEIYTIDVAAGDTYSLGFSSAAGLGYYDFDITSEAAFTYTDWGIITFSQLEGISVAGETWFRIEAASDGYVTAESLFDVGGNQITLDLYSSDMQMIDSGNAVNGTSRVDTYANSGDELFICVWGTSNDVDFRLSNLVSIDGTTVIVNGTGGDDVFAFTAGTNHLVAVNGVTHSFTANSISGVNFNGGAGDDSITMTGTAASETGTLRVGDATLVGSGYTAAAVGVENISVDGGGGNDFAYLYDSVGDDQFHGQASNSYLQGDGFLTQVTGFDRVEAYATEGGFDRAYFYDSTADDQFHGRDSYSYMRSDAIVNLADGFDRIEAYATEGGFDRAYFYDSAADDQFHGRDSYSYMRSGAIVNLADGFDRIEAYATEGGFDRAYFYDSAADDQFHGKVDYSYMRSGTIVNLADGFDRIEAYATEGGFDQAYFYDSAADDEFHGRDSYSYMRSGEIVNLADGFDRIEAYATEGGFDRAYFYDSAVDDEFHGRADYSYMRSDEIVNLADGFDRIEAYATEGGFDRAYFYDSASDDQFHGKTDYSYMRSDGIVNLASGFDRIEAYADAGGYDLAYLYDSEGDDQFHAKIDYAYMRSGTLVNLASNFDRVEAYATAGGNDQAYYYDTTGDDRFYDKFDYSYIRGNGLLNLSRGFGSVNVEFTAGGYDEAFVLSFDETVDTVFEDNDLVRIIRPNHQTDLSGFDRARVYEEDSYLDSLDALFDFVGST